jgi:hypothetical protein
MIALKKDINLGVTLNGVIQDISGKDVEVSTYYGRYAFIAVTNEKGVALCSVAFRATDNFRVEWDDTNGSGLKEKMIELADNGEFDKKFIFNNQNMKMGFSIADMLMALDKDGHVIISVATTPEGMNCNFWCSPKYRKVKSVDIYTEIAYGVALSRGWIAKNIDVIHFLMAVDNVVANKYIKRVAGGVLIGQITKDDIKYNVYGYTKESCIERAKARVLEIGMEWQEGKIS